MKRRCVNVLSPTQEKEEKPKLVIGQETKLECMYNAKLKEKDR